MRKTKIKLIGQTKTQKVDEHHSIKTVLPSKNHGKYSQIINSLRETQYVLPERQKLLEKLKVKGFRVENKQKAQYKLSIDLCSVSKRLDSVVVEVGIGGILKKMTILLIDMKYEMAERSIVGAGSFGIINQLKIGDSEYVIKSFQVPKEKQVISFAIAEYFYCSIASALNVGPFLPQNQYDLIYFSDRISFVMEKCQYIKSSLSDLEVQSDLLQSMQCLHQLQIVHRDIKPENIMYSPSMKKAVFIDFGMSKMLEEQIGQLSNTLFVGTYQLVCEQMKNIYHSQCYGEIDLYYNDAYALQFSLRSFKKYQKDGNLVFSNCILTSKLSSDPIIDGMYVGANFIYALHFSSLSSLLSILNDFPSFHQLFLYLFSRYCQQQLEISSVTHPYYEKIKHFQTELSLDEETLHFIMKIFSEIKPQFTKLFLQFLQSKKIEKIQQKKIHYKIASELRQEILKKDDIDEQFYLQCLISSIHNYPYSFSHEERVSFIQAAIKRLLPKYSQHNFQKKLFEIYRLMEQIFRKGRHKQKENLKKINFYYFLSYMKEKHFLLQEFIIEECCESVEQKLEEAILSSMFIFGQETVDIMLKKNELSLPQKIKNLLIHKDAYATQSEHLGILYYILSELIYVAQHYKFLEDSGLQMRATLNKIREMLKNQSLNRLFVKQLLDIFVIMENTLESKFIHKPTEIPTLKLFYFKSDTIFKYLILSKIIRFKAYGCIQKIIEDSWYLKLIQPIEIIFYYLTKNKTKEAEARLFNQISLNNNQLEFLQEIQGTLIAWIEANQVQEAFCKFKALLFFKILDKIVEICKENQQMATVGLLSIKFIISSINFFIQMRKKFGKLEECMSDEEFKKQAQSKLTQLVNLPKIEAPTKKALKIIMKYLDKKPEERYQVALEIIDLINSKNKQIQQTYWILISFICLIWNNMKLQAPYEITIREFILQAIQSSQQNQGLLSLYKIPDAVLAKVLIIGKKHLLFLDFFKNWGERFPMHRNVTLEIYKKYFFENIQYDRLMSIRNYFIQTQTLESIRKHGNLSFYVLLVFKLTHHSMTQKEKRRFLLLAYIMSSQHQTSSKQRFFIQWSLVGVWEFVNDYSKKNRNKLIWLRNTVRKIRKIPQYKKLFQRAIKKIKRKEVKAALKRKILFLQNIQKQSHFPAGFKV